MSSAFASNRATSVPYGVDVDLTFSAFRLVSRLDSRDTRFPNLSLDVYFISDQLSPGISYLADHL